MKGYIIKESFGEEVWYHASPLHRKNFDNLMLMLSTPDINEAEIWLNVDDANFVCSKVQKYHPEINPTVIEVDLKIVEVNNVE